MSAEETVSRKEEKFRIVFIAAVILALVFAGSITVGMH
jgi:hypothetical protein